MLNHLLFWTIITHINAKYWISSRDLNIDFALGKVLCCLLRLLWLLCTPVTSNPFRANLQHICLNITEGIHTVLLNNKKCSVFRKKKVHNAFTFINLGNDKWKSWGDERQPNWISLNLRKLSYKLMIPYINIIQGIQIWY